MAGVKCPNCGHATAIMPIPLGWGNLEVEPIFDPDGPYSEPGYKIAACMNCNQRLVVEWDYSDEHVVRWPLPTPTVSESIPSAIGHALRDARLAHAVGAEIGALLAARTTVIRMQRDKGVKSLKELRDAGLITATLFAQADEVRLWANLIGHEDVGEIDRQDVEELLGFLEAVLNVLYVEPARLQRLKERRGNTRP